MHHTGLFQVHPAAPLRTGLVADLVGQAFGLAIPGGKGLDRPDIRHRVHQLAADPRRLRRETLMLAASADTEAGDQRRDDGDEDDQRHRHLPADGEQHHHGAEEVDDRRHDLPRQPAIDRTGRGPEGGDAIAQRAGEMLGEIAHRVAGQVLEQVDADVHHAGHHGTATKPAAQAPEHVLGDDQADEQPQRPPDVGRTAIRGALRHRIDQQLHAVLHGHRAARRADDQCQQAAEMPGPRADVMPEKRHRTAGQRQLVGLCLGHGGRLVHDITAASCGAGFDWLKRACCRRSSSASPWCTQRRPLSSAKPSRPTGQCRSSAQPG